MEMSDAFVKNITHDWTWTGAQKPIMIKKFGLCPYIDDVKELFKNKDALIFYTKRMLYIYKNLRRPQVVRCYESFLLKAEGGK